MKIAFGLLAVAGLAAAASADFINVPANQRTVLSVTAAGLDEVTPAGTPVYAGIPGPYTAYAVGAFAENDDYQTGGAGNFQCDVVKFVGGVSAVGGTLDFFFLDSTGVNVISSFAVALPSAGDFIWTITLTPGPGFTAAHDGRLHIQTRLGTTGRWFMTTSAPTTGTNSLAVGHGSELVNPARAAFELQELVPSPGSLALLGLGGLAAARRRR